MKCARATHQQACGCQKPSTKPCKTSDTACDRRRRLSNETTHTRSSLNCESTRGAQSDIVRCVHRARTLPSPTHSQRQSRHQRQASRRPNLSAPTPCSVPSLHSCPCATQLPQFLNKRRTHGRSSRNPPKQFVAFTHHKSLEMSPEGQNLPRRAQARRYSMNSTPQPACSV
jgi:hypothetical protein